MFDRIESEDCHFTVPTLWNSVGQYVDELIVGQSLRAAFEGWQVVNFFVVDLVDPIEELSSLHVCGLVTVAS